MLSCETYLFEEARARERHPEVNVDEHLRAHAIGCLAVHSYVPALVHSEAVAVGDVVHRLAGLKDNVSIAVMAGELAEPRGGPSGQWGWW